MAAVIIGWIFWMGLLAFLVIRKIMLLAKVLPIFFGWVADKFFPLSPKARRESREKWEQYEREMYWAERGFDVTKAANRPAPGPRGPHRATSA